jgi:hypothetical protein
VLQIVADFLSGREIATLKQVCKITRKKKIFCTMTPKLMEPFAKIIAEANDMARVYVQKIRRWRDGFDISYKAGQSKGWWEIYCKPIAPFVTKLAFIGRDGDAMHMFQADDVRKAVEACINLKKLTCIDAWFLREPNVVQRIGDTIRHALGDCVRTLAWVRPEPPITQHLPAAFPRSLTCLDLRGQYDEFPDLRHVHQLRICTFGRRKTESDQRSTLSCHNVLPPSLQTLDVYWCEDMHVQGFSQLPHLTALHLGPSVTCSQHELLHCSRLSKLIIYTAEGVDELREKIREVSVIQDKTHHVDLEAAEKDDDMHVLCDELKKLRI